MPRKPRQYSNSGYLHVIVRGNGKQILFEESGDYRFYVTLLERYSCDEDITVVAYCLMENHVHLLLHDKARRTSSFMKKLDVSYAGFFNSKYERVGHVFQDRFQSRPVESDQYLLTLYRYILRNPLESGVCHSLGYAWSSYLPEKDPSSFVDAAIIRSLLPDETQYETFLQTEDNTAFSDEGIGLCDSHAMRPMNDETAKDLICRLAPGGDGLEIKALSREKRNAVLRELKEAHMSIRQIERLTGISRGIIQKV